MPIKPTYPGVYIQEVPSGVRTFTGVATSIAAFIGMARRKRLNVPTRGTSRPEFERIFGSDASIGELVPQVFQFFLNGGGCAWITRVAHGAVQAEVTLANEAGQDALSLRACDAREIEHYLQTQPDAAETLEGIFKWWLDKRCDERTLEDVQIALNLLVGRGVVRKTVRSGGITIYSHSKQGTGS